MDPDRIIAEVAKRNGVLLNRADPIMQIHTMLDLHTSDHQEREERLAQRDADLVARLSQVLNQAEKQATGDLARTAAKDLPYAIKQAALQQFRLWAVAGGVVLVLVAGAGFAGGWWYRGPAQIVAGITGGSPKCDDQADGSRLCWIPVFERLPPSPAGK